MSFCSQGGRAWLQGGRAWLQGGHVWLQGGHAWFYSGGACVVLFGGMHGFIWGVCMVLFGGVRGFIRGACVVLFGGCAWFYSGGHAWFYPGGACVVFSDTMRYGQLAGGTHPTGMHSCLLDFQIKMSGGIERMTCTEEDDEDTHRSDMEVASVFSRGICNVFSE